MENYSIATLRVDFNRYIARLAREYRMYYRTRHDAYNKTEKYEFSINLNPWRTIASIALDYDNAIDIFNKVYDSRKYLEQKLKEYLNCKHMSSATVIGSKSDLMSIDTDAAYEMYAKIPAIENVIFNKPATIILWDDHTKTVVKAQDGETYDPEKGLAMAIAKKILGNKRDYYHTFLKWLKKYEGDEPIKKDSSPVVDDFRVYYAYRKLLDALTKDRITKAEMGNLMQEAITYLEQALDV